MPVFDFREELHIERCKDHFGKPSFFPYYNYCRTKTDLSNNTVQIIDFGERVGIGDACKLIAEFEIAEQDIKLGIKAFLDTDKYNGEDTF